VRRPRDVGRPHGDRGHVVFRGEADVVVEELVVELGPEQGVVDRLGDVAVGKSVEERLTVARWDFYAWDSFGM
jgi:hypothetical protein